MKTVVITQSNYLPWRGYFDLFRRADEVILLDSVQYTRRDWRNRNLIKTANGPVWLTIPVEVKGRFFQAVDQTRVASQAWAMAHLRTIEAAYGKSACFGSVSPWLFALLMKAAEETMLSDINQMTLGAICNRLGIRTPIRRCTDLIDRDSLNRMTPNERLVQLTLAAHGTRYLSGPTARSYVDERAFAEAGIELKWMSYDGYSDYRQPHPPFEPLVSVIDLLLNEGPAAADFVGPFPAERDEPLDRMRHFA